MCMSQILLIQVRIKIRASESYAMRNMLWVLKSVIEGRFNRAISPSLGKLFDGFGCLTGGNDAFNMVILVEALFGINAVGKLGTC